MLRKIQRYRNAILACFSSPTTTLMMKEILQRVGENEANSDFSTSTFTTQVHKACVNVPSAYRSKAPKSLFYNSKDRTYRRATDQEIVDGLESAKDSQAVLTQLETADVPQSESTFALEADLQRYLVRNLHKLEKGLVPWDDTQQTEYFIQRREIDILAKDSNGLPVIIELKLGSGLYSVLGQAMHYRALVKKQLGVDRARIMIVASEITDDLQTASSEIGDVTLWEYTLSMNVEKVTEVA